jgi:hypothetical protein
VGAKKVQSSFKRKKIQTEKNPFKNNGTAFFWPIAEKEKKVARECLLILRLFDSFFLFIINWTSANRAGNREKEMLKKQKTK